MTRKNYFNLRCSEDELAAWKTCSPNLSSWLRRLANEEVARVRAEQGAQEDTKKKRERELKAIYPQGQSKCKHVTVGNFCYQCGEKRWK